VLIPFNEIFLKLKVISKIYIIHFKLKNIYSIGIHLVLVALLSSKAEIKYNPEYIIPSQIAHLINELGFHAEVLEAIENGVDIIDLNV
jgi:Cu+-exporting ATPase